MNTGGDAEQARGASGYRPDVVIVEPDPETRALVVVTAFPVWES